MLDSKRWLLAGLAALHLMICLSAYASAQTMGIKETTNPNGPTFIVKERGELLPDGKVMKWDSRIVYISNNGYFVPAGHHRHWGKIPSNYNSLSGQAKEAGVASKASL